jgi:hypothetical protein
LYDLRALDRLNIMAWYDHKRGLRKLRFVLAVLVFCAALAAPAEPPPPPAERGC